MNPELRIRLVWQLPANYSGGAPGYTGGTAKAYPLSALQQQSPVIDTLGGRPLIILVGEDEKSVRAYERLVDGRKLEFFAGPETSPPLFVDAETGSEWDFAGTSMVGPLAGRRLQKVTVLKDYWFDWLTYHPDTAVYKLGERQIR